jgi:orotate phosphoribosyltransferase
MLFGPAYKGIPLVSAVAIALDAHHGRDLPYSFNRKEVKDHGEGGITVGAPLEGAVMVVDDVISAGLSVREAVAIIGAAGARPAGVVIALDRQERGQGERSAIQELEAEFGIPVVSIIALAHLRTYLGERPPMAGMLARVEDYAARYGVG